MIIKIIVYVIIVLRCIKNVLKKKNIENLGS